ncbi:MAG TPA: TetR/AcrR family transcriptional regulator [Ktedonobacterales bacterium]|jgi:AcrR family transcriptional regulator
MSTQTTRQQILHAAFALIRREGVARLTIEAVAQEAGLSKGGVLYHFRSKESLIEAMVASLVERFDSDIETARREESEGERSASGSWLRAYIRASAGPAEDDEDTVALLAAVATDPRLLAPLQAQYARWQALAETDGVDPALATVIRLALDGLWMADLFGLAPPQGALREQIFVALGRMTEEGRAGRPTGETKQDM